MERALHFRLIQSVSESWSFVWALCKSSGGFSSPWTTSPVQAKAGRGGFRHLLFSKGFSRCLQKSFHLSLSLQKVSGKKLYPLVNSDWMVSLRGEVPLWATSVLLVKAGSETPEVQCCQFQLHFSVRPWELPSLAGDGAAPSTQEGSALLPGLSRAVQGTEVYLTPWKHCCSFPASPGAWFVQDQQSLALDLLYAGEVWLWVVFVQRSLGFVASQKQKQIKTDQGKTSCIIRLYFSVIWNYFALDIQTNFKNWKWFCCLCLIIKPEDSLTGAVGVLRGWKPDVMYKILLLDL